MCWLQCVWLQVSTVTSCKRKSCHVGRCGGGMVWQCVYHTYLHRTCFKLKLWNCFSVDPPFDMAAVSMRSGEVEAVRGDCTMQHTTQTSLYGMHSLQQPQDPTAGASPTHTLVNITRWRIHWLYWTQYCIYNFKVYKQCPTSTHNSVPWLPYMIAIYVTGQLSVCQLQIVKATSYCPLKSILHKDTMSMHRIGKQSFFTFITHQCTTNRHTCNHGKQLMHIQWIYFVDCTNWFPSSTSDLDLSH